jgi:hypothetical protein
MNIKFFPSILLIIFLSVLICSAQTTKKQTATPNTPNSPAQAPVKSTPAYAEVLLRKTELESVLEDLLVAYTEEFPKVKETRYELSLIERDLAKLLTIGNADLARGTLALGKLMVRRVQLETDLWALKSKYGDEHPDVKRAKRRVASFDKAIGEILS